MGGQSTASKSSCARQLGAASRSQVQRSPGQFRHVPGKGPGALGSVSPPRVPALRAFSRLCLPILFYASSPKLNCILTRILFHSGRFPFVSQRHLFFSPGSPLKGSAALSPQAMQQAVGAQVLHATYMCWVALGTLFLMGEGAVESLAGSHTRKICHLKVTCTNVPNYLNKQTVWFIGAWAVRLWMIELFNLSFWSVPWRFGFEKSNRSSVVLKTWLNLWREWTWNNTESLSNKCRKSSKDVVLVKEIPSPLFSPRIHLSV